MARHHGLNLVLCPTSPAERVPGVELVVLVFLPIVLAPQVHLAAAEVGEVAEHHRHGEGRGPVGVPTDVLILLAAALVPDDLYAADLEGQARLPPARGLHEPGHELLQAGPEGLVCKLEVVVQVYHRVAHGGVLPRPEAPVLDVLPLLVGLRQAGRLPHELDVGGAHNLAERRGERQRLAAPRREQQEEERAAHGGCTRSPSDCRARAARPSEAAAAEST
mmetsp:Transcript_97031/g.235868  ORF Transcript_97031/g.235868 Transcript_97031/m.235868 type:complete len:220 (-) Transcript_97031:7-666(-)